VPLLHLQFPTISERQIQMFKAAMPKENVRPSMPSHGRRFQIHEQTVSLEDQRVSVDFL
jgi:hypothetical protein